MHDDFLQDLNVGEVDCTSDLAKDICQQYSIKGYPTLLLFPIDEEALGKYYEFQGIRSIENFEKFAL